MYLEIEDVKRHLYIETTDDDRYIADLITVAEDAVKRDLNVSSLSDLEGEDGELSPSVVHAMLLLIGTWYNCRESVTYGVPNRVPHAYEYLLDLCRCYYKENN